MGFLDNTKDRLRNMAKGIGEETVRVVDYDEILEQEEKAKAAPKTENTVEEKPAPKQKVERKPLKFPKFADKPKPVKAQPEKPVKVAPAPVVEPEPEVFEVPEDYSDSAFAVINPSAFTEPTALTNIDMSPVDTPEARAGRVQDVLDLLRIPATFEIERDVFLPEDLRDISFDTQVPQGYDMGQVNTFVGQTKMSINVLTSLLKLRNEHIAQLATTIDRMQVDANNLKYEREIAAGINILPTEDDEHLQNQNSELKIKVQQLTNQLEQYRQGGHVPSGGLSENEHKKYEALQEEVSLLRRDVESNNEEITDLTNRNALLVEENDLLVERLSALSPLETSDVAEDGDSAFAPLSNDDDDSLPGIDGIDDTDGGDSLPSLNFDFGDEDTSAPADSFEYNPADYSDWDNKADDFGQYAGYNDSDSYATTDTGNAAGSGVGYSEEEDDEIDRLQKEWGNN